MKQTLADALAARGYDTLTPVQTAVTADELADADLLVSAQTGSGKTVGFGLAIASSLLGEGDRFDQAGPPLALVIAPTRELALQVKRELAWLYAGAGAHLASCVGGMDMRDERRALGRGAHIVVATPGRLRDHVMRGSIDLTNLKAVVLDEADEMLDLGFREDLEFILGECPEGRRTLLFSATVPRAIGNLAKQYQKDAVRVTTVAESKQHSDIEYQALTVSGRDSENAIINVLRFHEAPNALVFCNTRAMVNRMTTRLSNRGFSVVALSGELSQQERTNALQAMRDGRARVCVATDVAARGIDLPNLDLVIHAELPTNQETLLHRSGRTGRAGRKGVSALIIPPAVRKKAERILKFAKVSAAWIAAPSAEQVQERDHERMLADPAWSDPIEENEAALVAELVEKFDPQAIAAAYLRLYNAKQSAPEELSEVTNEAPKPRAPFGASKWVSMSGGRASGAEPRRLLPMFCKAGNITKDDIGAIRIQEDTSYIEIKETSMDGFLKALGADMSVEGERVTVLDKAPAFAARPGNSGPPRKGGRDAKPYQKRDRDDRGPKPPRGEKPYEPRAPREEAPQKFEKPNPTAPIDYNDAPVVKKKKPKGGKPPARKPYTSESKRPEGVVEPFKGKKPRHAKAGKKPGGASTGLAPKVGKPNSKKNKARRDGAANPSASLRKRGGGDAPKRKS